MGIICSHVHGNDGGEEGDAEEEPGIQHAEVGAGGQGGQSVGIESHKSQQSKETQH